MNYINCKIYGLPRPQNPGVNTRYKKDYSPYVHFVTIGKYRYFKVHVKRSGKSKIKYFKTLKHAEIFVELLKLNPYL